MIRNCPYLFCSFLENKCSREGTYALVRKTRVCFVFPSGSAQHSLLNRTQKSAVLCLPLQPLWRFQAFIKNIWHHWTAILVGFWNTLTNHFTSKLDLTVTTLHLENISSLILGTCSKKKKKCSLFTTLQYSFYKINYNLHSVCVLHLLSARTQGSQSLQKKQAALFSLFITQAQYMLFVILKKWSIKILHAL